MLDLTVGLERVWVKDEPLFSRTRVDEVLASYLGHKQAQELTKAPIELLPHKQSQGERAGSAQTAAGVRIGPGSLTL